MGRSSSFPRFGVTVSLEFDVFVIEEITSAEFVEMIPELFPDGVGVTKASFFTSGEASFGAG